MDVRTLVSFLQSYCNEGRALDEVEILDSDGNTICALDKICLATDHDREVVQITVHHKKGE